MALNAGHWVVPLATGNSARYPLAGIGSGHSDDSPVLDRFSNQPYATEVFGGTLSELSGDAQRSPLRAMAAIDTKVSVPTLNPVSAYLPLTSVLLTTCLLCRAFECRVCGQCFASVNMLVRRQVHDWLCRHRVRYGSND